MAKLTHVFISQTRKPGLYGDGNGLYLNIGPGGAKSWIFRFQIAGKRREMGLGPVLLGDKASDDDKRLSLKEARDEAAAKKDLVRAGIDPIQHRDAKDAADQAKKARDEAHSEMLRRATFEWCSAQYITVKSAGWSNAKHVQQWQSTLATYAFPVIGNLPVSDIEQAHIARILDPLWGRRTETASRLRGRIERVLDWAITRGYRETTNNPAVWRGRLEHLYPAPSAAQPVQHHKALPYSRVPEFLSRLRDIDGTAARALEFTILTATRSSEARGARWSEIDLDAMTWTIPAQRMKAKKDHRVPLSARAIEILREMQAAHTGGYVFSPTGRCCISETSVRNVLTSIDATITTHGFRSSFRDWASEQTAYPHEVCEMALAHTITSAVERAYRRGDLFEKRRQLMAAWAEFCTAPAQSGDVVPIRRSESM